MLIFLTGRNCLSSREIVLASLPLKKERVLVYRIIFQVYVWRLIIIIENFLGPLISGIVSMLLLI